MKNLIIPTLFAFVLILSFACKDKSTNLNIIQSDTCEIVSDVIKLTETGCLLRLTTDTCFVINNDSTYNALLGKNSNITACSSYHLPIVDFNQRTVLGFRTLGNIDEIWERHVKICNNSKKIIYFLNDTLKLHEIITDKARFSLNLISIPKVPAGYTVEFDTSYTVIYY
jgi:hypothetical protein